MKKELKNCFVISPIGIKNSEVRKHSDQLLKYLIAPITKKTGFTAIRADNISESGMISVQIMEHIINDELVIADLTGANPNVYYELAVRHAIKKPFIQLIREGDKIPFDIKDLRTIEFNISDPDSIEDAKSELEKQILAIDKGTKGEIITPISATLRLSTVYEANAPIQTALEEIMYAITKIEERISEKSGLDLKDDDDVEYILKRRKKSDCIVSTACTRSKNLPDNCIELESLRKLRDNYILNLDNGKNIMIEYYSLAPGIVRAINATPHRKIVYNKLYRNLVLNTVKYINEGDMNSAYQNYSNEFNKLKWIYASEIKLNVLLLECVFLYNQGQGGKLHTTKTICQLGFPC